MRLCFKLFLYLTLSNFVIRTWMLENVADKSFAFRKMKATHVIKKKKNSFSNIIKLFNNLTCLIVFKAESKPPILLKKLQPRSNKSDIFSDQVSAPSKPISRSYNQEQADKNRLPFEDSMKIIKKNNPSPNNSVFSNNSIDAGNSRNNSFNQPRNLKKQTEDLSSESSSISSVASSDDNDPGTRLIRLEKRKKK